MRHRAHTRSLADLDDEPPAAPGEDLFGDAEEMELAAELLAAVGRGRLDRFCEELVRRALRGAADSPAARALGQNLASAVGRVLQPGGGGVAVLSADAGHRLGLELEGLSAEDQEFEVARRIVQRAGEALRIAAPAGGRWAHDDDVVIEGP